MAKTRGQCLALYHAIVSNPKVVAHLEALVGLGEVRSAATFEMENYEELAKLYECVNTLLTSLEVLEDELNRRLHDLPRQSEIPGVNAPGERVGPPPKRRTRRQTKKGA